MIATPYALTRTEGTMLAYYGALVTVKATAATTDGSFSLVEQWGRAGAAPPWHIHHPNDEMFFALEGHITGFVRGEDGEVSEFPSGPGDMFYIPKDTEHSFRLDEESKTLVVTFQPGSENYFVERGRQYPNTNFPRERTHRREDRRGRGGIRTVRNGDHRSTTRTSLFRSTRRNSTSVRLLDVVSPFSHAPPIRC